MEIKKSMHCFSGINCVREERLGFQDLQNFNIVLLVKQLWKVIDKPEPLFVNAFKEKNYRKECLNFFQQTIVEYTKIVNVELLGRK